MRTSDAAEPEEIRPSEQGGIRRTANAQAHAGEALGELAVQPTDERAATGPTAKPHDVLVPGAGSGWVLQFPPIGLPPVEAQPSDQAIMEFRFERRDLPARETFKRLAAEFEKVHRAASAVRDAPTAQRAAGARARLEATLVYAMECDEAANFATLASELGPLAKLVQAAEREPPLPNPVRPVAERRAAIVAAVRQAVAAIPAAEIASGAADVARKLRRIVDIELQEGRTARRGDPREGGTLPNEATRRLVEWAKLNNYPRGKLAKDMAAQMVRDKPGSKTTPKWETWKARLATAAGRAKKAQISTRAGGAPEGT